MHRQLQLLAICMVVHSVCLAGVGAAAQCKPMAYLFRHAEDINKVKDNRFDVTLTTSGVAHATLYIEMIGRFQQEKPDYCPIQVVYALNPIKPGNMIGTSNPYWTANPLAQVAQTRLDGSTPQNTNPIIAVKISTETDPLILTEKLDNGEREQFVADIKGALNNQQSVAIFWTSQGMCTVAEALGQSIPPYDCVDVKPARNSVFQFNYNVPGETFTNVTEYAQCFNYNKNTDSFTNGTYYCQYSYNLNDWDYPEDTTKNYPGFWGKLQKLSGRICAKNSPPDTCNQP